MELKLLLDNELQKAKEEIWDFEQSITTTTSDIRDSQKNLAQGVLEIATQLTNLATKLKEATGNTESDVSLLLGESAGELTMIRQCGKDVSCVRENSIQKAADHIHRIKGFAKDLLDTTERTEAGVERMELMRIEYAEPRITVEKHYQL
jgi:predicted  nucleic acid-binding Zn-ribbon protein